MAKFITTFKNFFRPLNRAQKTLFVLTSAGLFALMGLLFYWAMQPSYTLLFGSLSPDSAQTIVEELQSMGVPYELRDNGKAIMVPRSQVYDLRLRFASDGASGSDYQGYELFDQNALGMTDFMQRLNKKRALEGELARTVNNLEQVESSRIHIVLPERSPFQEATVQPSASVIVNLRKGNKLGKQQIEGIGALIAGSVEALTIDNVTILDQQGKRISEDVLVSPDVAASSAQIKVRQNMENYLTNKGQSMLDRVLGPGNSILRVSTEHNFDQLVRQSNSVDPNSRTIISEEKRSTANSDLMQEPAATFTDNQVANESLVTEERTDESTVQVRNYEVTRIEEQYEKSTGQITQINASLLLNYKTEVTENEEGGTTEYIRRSDEEIKEIQNIMATALGIKTERGDELTISQIQFEDPFAEVESSPFIFTDPVSAFEIIRWVLVAIVTIVVVVMIYRTSRNINADNLKAQLSLAEKKKQQLADNTPEEEHKYLEGDTEEPEEDIYKQKLSNEAQAKLDKTTSMTREIENFLDNNAKEAASLVKSLMIQKSM